jgi:hypothetical protein
MKCLSHFICCGWAYGCTLTQLHLCRWGKNFGKFGLLRVSPNNIMVSCLEDVNHPTLLLTSILHVLKVFEHLHMLWMGMWVVMFEGCKPPNSASYIHIACIKSIQAPSYAVDERHIGAPLHRHACAGMGAKFWKIGAIKGEPK